MKLKIYTLPNVGSEPEDASLREVEVFPSKFGQSEADAAIALIAGLAPSRTGRTGVYSWIQGTIEVHDASELKTEKLDEKVQLLEIERGIGRRDPMRLPDTHETMTAIQLHIQNPYIQLVFGGAVTLAGLACIQFGLTNGDGASGFDLITALIGGVLVGVAMYQLVFRGARRISWWHAARRYARRRGEKLPASLKFFS